MGAIYCRSPPDTLKVQGVTWRQPKILAFGSRPFMSAAKMLVVPVDGFIHTAVTTAGARNTAEVSWRNVPCRAPDDAAIHVIACIPPTSTAYTGFPPDKSGGRDPSDLLSTCRPLACGDVCRQRSCCRCRVGAAFRLAFALRWQIERSSEMIDPLHPHLGSSDLCRQCRSAVRVEGEPLCRSFRVAVEFVDDAVAWRGPFHLGRESVVHVLRRRRWRPSAGSFRLEHWLPTCRRYVCRCPQRWRCRLGRWCHRGRRLWLCRRCRCCWRLIDCWCRACAS